MLLEVLPQFRIQFFYMTLLTRVMFYKTSATFLPLHVHGIQYYTKCAKKKALFVQHEKFLTSMHLQHSLYKSQDNGTFLSHFKLEKVVSNSSDSSNMTAILSPYVRKNDE